MYFRRVKAFRGAVGAPPKSGLWLGPARVIMTEPVQQWSSWAQYDGTSGRRVALAWRQVDQKPSHSASPLERAQGRDCTLEKSYPSVFVDK